MYNFNKSNDWYINRVKILLKKPQPVQKSKEWFKARCSVITASEASSCIPKTKEICEPYEKLFNKKFKYDITKNLSSYDTKEDYIINKCRTFYGENLFIDNIYTLHGKKYEEISCRLYRILFKTPVIEFGLLTHSRLNWLAASPDGITPNGIMLEIKNPNKMYKIPSLTYYTQTQIQMESANLDLCDFLVCEVKELNSEQDFLDKILDENINQTVDYSLLELVPTQKEFKGIVLNKVDLDNNDVEKYIYPPDNLILPNDFINWANKIIDENLNFKIVKNYYIINEWSIIRIKRDKEWFNLIKPYLKETIIFIRKLQEDKILFENYRKKIHHSKSKKHFDNFNNSICLIESNDSVFQINRNYEESESNSEEPFLDKKSLSSYLIDE